MRDLDINIKSIQQIDAQINEFCLSLSQTSWLSFSNVKELYIGCNYDKDKTLMLFNMWSQTGVNPYPLLKLTNRPYRA